ncbi:MAG: nitroreductase family protein [Fusobacteriaceae bacterium]
MLNFLERRSVRKFLEKSIKEEEIKEILKVALVSPSGRNKKPYEFILVKDKDILKKLSVAKKMGGKLIEEAPLAIVVLGNKNVTDLWIEDCSIASTLIQLKAWELGIGSCWVQIRTRNDDSDICSETVVKKLLDIPEELGVLCILALGYPDENKQPYEDKDMDFKKIHMEKY